MYLLDTGDFELLNGVGLYIRPHCQYARTPIATTDSSLLGLVVLIRS